MAEYDTDAMTDDCWDELEALASKLEDAWKKGGPVDLAAFLPEPASPLRREALVELIKVDLECRWRRGQPVVLDYYLDKFSEIGRSRDLPAKLIFEEYRVRQLWGDKPQLTLYQNRFPAQFEQLNKYVSEEPLPTIAHLGTVAKPSAAKAAGDRPKHVSATDPTVAATRVESGFKQNKQQIGEYRMIERLGSGAFGEVWKVELPGGIMKAVKIIFRPIDHEEAKRELESLELIKGLRHHFLLQTHSFSPSEDRLRILMDLADGSLRDLLKQAQKEGKTGLPLHVNVKWLREAAEALDYLHNKGVQHRDIKPENILLSEGNVRVADFGLARHQATRRLASGSGAGTPLYMPPEAWNDKQHANSDQYSLAATYAECRLGRRIFAGDGLATLMQAHIHDRPKLDPLPADEQNILLKALAKNPDHRYPSCSAFAEDLLRAVAKNLPPGSLPGVPLADLDESPRSRRARQKQKQLQSIILAVGFLGVLVIGAIVASLMMSPPEPIVDRIALPAAGPAGSYRPVAGSPIVVVGGKHLPSQIECQLAGNPELTIRFNLVSWTEMGKQPFYLMENKISNEIYEVFAAANPAAVNGSRWRLGARAKFEATAPLYPTAALFGGPPHIWNFPATRVLFDPRPNAILFQESWPQPEDFGVGGDKSRWPVLRVDIIEAERCAAWFGGVLPSVEQWDKAAGRFETGRGEGPYEAPFTEGSIAIGRETKGPLPVGAATKDVCKFSGCRDMAGNGLEWTRTFRYDGETGEFFGDVGRVPLLAKTPLRGRSYKASDPLAYADLEARPLDLEFFERVRTAGYDAELGFRVALIP